MAKIATVRAKVLRRRILELLKAYRDAGADEGWMAVESAAEVLDAEYGSLTDQEVLGECGYLEEAHLVRMRNVEEHRSSPKRWKVRIRTGGIDLLQETAPPHPGVHDPRR